jgi:hypothetical protein
MTEQEWMTSVSPALMLAELRGRATTRQLRLFAVACCRRVGRLITDPALRRAVEVAERYADGCATEEERATAAAEASTAPSFAAYGPRHPPTHLLHPECHAAWAAVYAYAPGYDRDQPDSHAASAAGQAYFAHCADRLGYWNWPSWSFLPHIPECRAQAALVREVFGNPFRPAVVEPAWLAWQGGVVRQLASVIYEQRRYGDLPVLADALEDAGCADAAILDHCRGVNAHVRGCWVLDCLLGRV